MRKNVAVQSMGIGLLFVLLLMGGSKSAAEPSPEKARDIKKLLVVSGIYDQMGYMKTSLLNSISAGITMTYPKTPDEFWREYYDLINEKEMEKLISQVVVVYDKHMSHDVVKKLIQMFETPFWEEWKTKMPLISREAGLIGSKWGQKIVQSDTFNEKVDALVLKYKLEKLNSEKNGKEN